MAAAFGLYLGYGTHSSSPKTSVIVKYCYALPLVVLGAQHFTHNAFVTAKIPTWFPLIDVFDYLIGIVLIAAALSILFTQDARRPAIGLGVFLMTLLLLHHIPLLAANVRNAIEWTGAMLDLALAAGAFIISACTSPPQRSGGQAPASMLPE